MKFLLLCASFFFGGGIILDNGVALFFMKHFCYIEIWKLKEE